MHKRFLKITILFASVMFRDILLLFIIHFLGISNNGINFVIHVHSLICDLPGKAMALLHKLFNGKFGCTVPYWSFVIVGFIYRIEL
jgi:hypothetical protein